MAYGGGQGIVPNGEGEPVWLTAHQRDSQPEGERERERKLVNCRITWRPTVTGCYGGHGRTLLPVRKISLVVFMHVIYCRHTLFGLYTPGIKPDPGR